MEHWFERDVRAADEQGIAAFMRELSSLPVHVPKLPSADVVWIKAQLVKRWEAERKARAPLEVLEPLQIAGGLVAAGLLLAWSIPGLLRAAATTADILW